jgi:hypothetical protein
MIKNVACRNCRRAGPASEPRSGHPYGWYSLSVNIPPELDHTGNKPYRWVGLFCSIGCLMAHEDVLIRDAETMRGLYDRE